MVMALITSADALSRYLDPHFIDADSERGGIAGCPFCVLGWCCGFVFFGFVSVFAFVFGHTVFCAFICSPTARDQLTDHATS